MIDSTERDDWLRLIKTEYCEVPGLKLTGPQAQRLWGLEDAVCAALLDSLIASQFLSKTPAQTYVLAERR